MESFDLTGMVIRLANDEESRLVRKHTIECAPRERTKDYSDYQCIVAIKDNIVFAYLFFWCIPPNIGEIHKIAFKPGCEDALVRCIQFAYRYLEGMGVREVSTYIGIDNYWELELYRRLNFDMFYYKAILKTDVWWKDEVGLSWDDMQDIRECRGLPRSSIIPETIESTNLSRPLCDSVWLDFDLSQRGEDDKQVLQR